MLKFIMMNNGRYFKSLIRPFPHRPAVFASFLAVLFLAGNVFSQSPDTLIVTDDVAPPGDTAVVSILLRNTQFSVGGFSTLLVLGDSLNASVQRVERGEDVVDFDHFFTSVSEGGCRIVGIADLPGGGSPSPLGPGLHELARVFVFVEDTAPVGMTDSLFFVDDGLPPERDNSISDSTGYINVVPSLIGGEIVFDAPIGIDDDPGNLPTTVGLHQNYPNPFNARTTIRFDVTEPVEAVSLSIYDLMGRRLRSRSFGYLAAGSYEFVWDGRGEDGQVAASGIYFYRLEIGSSYVETKRMTLLK